MWEHREAAMVGKVSKTPRSLSHDEAKAAEAAFQGHPFNDDWSDAARLVYEGMLAAIHKRNQEQIASHASVDPEGADRERERLQQREMQEVMVAAVRKARRSLRRGLAAIGLTGSGWFIGLLALITVLLNPASPRAEAMEPAVLREQMIPILGITMEQTPTGTVANLLLSFEERRDRRGLAVLFRKGPGRFSRMAQTAVEQAIYRTARAAGLSPDSWNVMLSVPYAGMTIYGESLSAMVALAVIALAKGEFIPPDRVMTGAVTPDGHIAPVGAVPLKVTAASEAHMRRVLVPDELDVTDADWQTPFLVQVSPVSSVSQAYEALTDHPLRAHITDDSAFEQSE
jgi:hypothetical protein